MPTVIAEVLEKFRTETAQIDETLHALLKGHLLLEGQLDQILRLHVFNPDQLDELRLQFVQKVALCRSLALRKGDLGEWQVLLALNALRNDFAHNLRSTKREARMKQVRDLLLQASKGAPYVDDLNALSEADVLRLAIVHCLGFLSAFASDAASFRRVLHKLDRNLNPDTKEFELSL